MITVFGKKIPYAQITGLSIIKALQSICETFEMQTNARDIFATAGGFSFCLSEDSVHSCLLSSQSYSECIAFAKRYGFMVEERTSTQAECIYDAMVAQYNAGEMRWKSIPILTFVCGRDEESGVHYRIPAVLTSFSNTRTGLCIRIGDVHIEMTRNDYLSMQQSVFYYAAINPPINSIVQKVFLGIDNTTRKHCLYAMFHSYLHQAHNGVAVQRDLIKSIRGCVGVSKISTQMAGFFGWTLVHSRTQTMQYMRAFSELLCLDDECNADMHEAIEIYEGLHRQSIPRAEFADAIEAAEAIERAYAKAWINVLGCN